MHKLYLCKIFIQVKNGQAESNFIALPKPEVLNSNIPGHIRGKVRLRCDDPGGIKDVLSLKCLHLYFSRQKDNNQTLHTVSMRFFLLYPD